MLLINLKVVFRSWFTGWRHKVINITGLTIGLTCSTMIALHVVNEHRYDRFHAEAETIYRIGRTTINSDGQKEMWATTVRAIAYTFQRDLSVVKAAATFSREKMNLMHNGVPILEQNIIEADSNFFDVFTLKPINGNLDHALNLPQSIVLSESSAMRYFNTTDVVGKILKSESDAFTVTAVVKDFPTQSHFHFDMIPLRTIEIEHNTNWLGTRKYYTYVKLRDNGKAFLDQQLSTLKQKYEPLSTDTYFLQRLTNIHLNSELRSELEANSSERSLNVILLVALFVIVSAGINYTNLANADAIRRAREIGVRKTSGATKQMLIMQFLLESVMTAVISFTISILAVGILVHPFNSILGKSLNPFESSMISWWLVAFLFSVIVGFIAGIYPALFLSSYNPVMALKGISPGIGSTGQIRKYLVGLQFAISTSLVLFTITIFRQMDFIKTTDPGFDQDQVLVISDAGRLKDRAVLEDQIKRLAHVSYVGVSTASPGSGHWTSNMRANLTDNYRAIDFCQINYDYIDALGLTIIAGRKFSEQSAADTINSIILNETAVRDLGIKDPVGKQVIWDEGARDTVIYATIVGVVKDFHYQSFHEQIRPFALLVGNTFFVHGDFTSNLFIKFNGENSDIVAVIEKLWKTYVPGRPFTYSFMDDRLANLHKTESQFSRLFNWITTIALFISAIGLVGLISLITQQRTREIGIRKVLGASITSLVILLNNEILKVGLVALFISSPLAAYFINQWLNGFAYHIEIGWDIFALLLVATAVLLLAATGYHSLKAAMRNPVNSLKTE